MCASAPLSAPDPLETTSPPNTPPQNPKPHKQRQPPTNKQVNKQTSEVVFDHLHATAFQFSPLGRTILGPEDNIRSITRQHLADYMATHYRGPRMVLAAAGAVDHDALVKLASAAFGGVPDEAPGQSVASLVAADPARYTGSDVRDRRPDDPSCCVAVAFKGASWTDPDSIPLMVMQTMLGARPRCALLLGCPAARCCLRLPLAAPVALRGARPRPPLPPPPAAPPRRRRPLTPPPPRLPLYNLPSPSPQAAGTSTTRRASTARAR